MNSKPTEKESESKVPADLRQALAADPKAKAKWGELTPIARRDFIIWIDQAKQAVTRQSRIERTCSMLKAGKRRPCCFTIVAFDLYKGFKANPKAKAQWSGLNPTARRDLIDWIDTGKHPEGRSHRIEKACALLASGKECP